MKQLSIIIVSYNTKQLTQNCIQSLVRVFPKAKSISTEIIVVDNASSDGTLEMLYQMKKTLTRTFPLTVLPNKKNLGYSKGNNRGLSRAGGKYVLFLNSDVVVENVDFQNLLSYLETHPDVGALTVRVNLETGDIDPASHRGFPTVWRSFCYFSGLERLLGNIPGLRTLFGGYHLTKFNLHTLHEIDSPTGAFYLTRKDILTKVRGFDESFFMYGEDLDLSYRIKKLGYKILYYPKYTVTHLKYQSGIKSGHSAVQKKTKEHFYNAMEIFYNKHYKNQYSKIITNIVYFLISQKRKAL